MGLRIFGLMVLITGLTFLGSWEMTSAERPPGRGGEGGGGGDEPPAFTLDLLLEHGGRLAWYQGVSHELIAYDAIFDLSASTKNTEVYTINPDGTGTQCVTCNAPFPKGYVGQPAWHPDGEHLVIQVENENSAHRTKNHMSLGFDNDLWIINKSGTVAERVWSTPVGFAALHPHFNADGTKLMFAERDPTNVFLNNKWDGWRIHLADFDISKIGLEKLTNHTTISPNGDGFYETHEFISDGEIMYSYTADGETYVDDIYTTTLDLTTSPVNLINSPTTWDEHGHFSPTDSQTLALMSSKFDEKWKAPSSVILKLKTELYRKVGGGELERLTNFNKTKTDQFVVSDFDWDRLGGRIVFQLASFGKRDDPADPQVWIITFPTP